MDVGLVSDGPDYLHSIILRPLLALFFIRLKPLTFLRFYPSSSFARSRLDRRGLRTVVLLRICVGI